MGIKWQALVENNSEVSYIVIRYQSGVVQGNFSVREIVPLTQLTQNNNLGSEVNFIPAAIFILDEIWLSFCSTLIYFLLASLFQQFC